LVKSSHLSPCTNNVFSFIYKTRHLRPEQGWLMMALTNGWLPIIFNRSSSPLEEIFNGTQIIHSFTLISVLDDVFTAKGSLSKVKTYTMGRGCGLVVSVLSFRIWQFEFASCTNYILYFAIKS